MMTSIREITWYQSNNIREIFNSETKSNKLDKRKKRQQKGKKPQCSIITKVGIQVNTYDIVLVLCEQ